MPLAYQAAQIRHQAEDAFLRDRLLNRRYREMKAAKGSPRQFLPLIVKIGMARHTTPRRYHIHHATYACTDI